MKAPTMAALAVAPRERGATVDGKAAAFEREALPHLDAVYRFALSLAGDAAGAEDLAQETLLNAFRSWHRYRPGTNIRAWLFTILRNLAISNHRRTRHHFHPCDFSELEGKLATSQPGSGDVERQTLDRVTAERVISAMQALSPDFREALVLRDVEGFSYSEVADLTGVSVGTVKSRLFRARRVLQQRLAHLAAEVA